MFAMTMRGDSKSLPEPGIRGNRAPARRNERARGRDAHGEHRAAARVDARRGVTRGTSTLEVRT